MPSLISISDLIDQTWSQYKKALPTYVELSGWLIIVALLYTVALFFYPNAGTLATHPNLTSLEIIGTIIYGVTDIIVAPLLGFWVFIAVTFTAWNIHSGNTPSAASVIKEANKRFLPVLTVTILVVLTLILAQIITIGPSLAIGTIGFFVKSDIILGAANALLILGIFASVILTSKWTLYYIMAPYAAIVDSAKTTTALTSSRALIKGRFWAVVWRFFLPKIIFALFGMLAATIIVTVIQQTIVGAAGLNLDTQQRIANIATAIIPIIIAIFLDPLIFTSDVILYRSLKATNQTA